MLIVEGAHRKPSSMKKRAQQIGALKRRATTNIESVRVDVVARAREGEKEVMAPKGFESGAQTTV